MPVALDDDVLAIALIGNRISIKTTLLAPQTHGAAQVRIVVAGLDLAAGSGHSLIRPTTGSAQSVLNSVLSASGMPALLRAYSITATCIPRQIPRYGILFSRAYCTVNILPSTPR